MIEIFIRPEGDFFLSFDANETKYLLNSLAITLLWITFKLLIKNWGLITFLKISHVFYL